MKKRYDTHTHTEYMEDQKNKDVTSLVAIFNAQKYSVPMRRLYIYGGNRISL